MYIQIISEEISVENTDIDSTRRVAVSLWCFSTSWIFYMLIRRALNNRRKKLTLRSFFRRGREHYAEIRAA